MNRSNLFREEQEEFNKKLNNLKNNPKEVDILINLSKGR
jgi:hypothetical protein